MRTRLFLSLSILVWSPAVFGQSQEEVVESILTEGKENSQVWRTLDHLCDEIGTRLTGSTRCLEANTWARDEFERMGLSNAHLHQWGTIPVGFDRGPSHARMLAPVERELEFTTPSWSHGTEGPVRATVRLLPATLEELEEVGFDYTGCWILCPPEERGGRGQPDPERVQARERRKEIDAALDEIGIAGRLRSSRDELVLTSSIPNWRSLDTQEPPRGITVEVRKSDYQAMADALAGGAEVLVEVDLQHRFVPGPVPVYNTIAEIPGTERPEEVVIVSGHLDSWDGPGSKGAQDNGTGSAVVIEAARILMAVQAQPKRTIRFALWTGEEQGLLGSAGYVKDLSDEERARISVCFVDDGGTNYEGGLICLDTQAPIFEEAVAPLSAAFPDLPMEIVARPTVSGGMGSDHASFNAVGIPAFFWMESGSGGREGKDYQFVHHTQHDTQRYAIEEYLVQSATCSALVAYHMAMLPELLPRDNPNAKAPGVAADPSFQVVLGPLSGEWKVVLLDDSVPDLGIVMTLETAADGRLRGTTRAMGQTDVLTGTWDAAGGQGEVRGATEFGEVRYVLKPDGANLGGSLSVMGRDLPVRGEPQPFTATPVSGLWRGTIAEMNSEFRLLLQVRDTGAVSGRFQSSQSDSPLFDGTWDAEAQNVGFEYDYPHGGRLAVEAHLQDGKLVGKIGERLSFEAVPATDG